MADGGSTFFQIIQAAAAVRSIMGEIEALDFVEAEYGLSRYTSSNRENFAHVFSTLGDEVGSVIHQ